MALHEVTLRMVVWCTQNLRRDGYIFMWLDQPCQRCKYTTSVDIQKTRYKKLVTHVEPHASAQSLLKRAENGAIWPIINQSINQRVRMCNDSMKGRGERGGREREGQKNSNSKTSFYKDYSSGSVKT